MSRRAALNHGYPFLDYSSETALTADAQLMAAYAAQAGAPVPSTAWPGPRHALPAGRFVTGVQQPPGVDLLAGWLQIAAGIIRLRQLPHSTIAYRTSPSGGARHPTDLGVRLGAGWPEQVRGGWWYDPLAHALVPAGDTIPEQALGAPTDAVFAVTSHVARAMWRYRDVRAFRPVLIDAGHVVETLICAISAAGWDATWHPAPGFVDDAGQLDPVLGYVVASEVTGPRNLSTDQHRPEPAESPGGALRTNPLISVSITATDVRAENHQRGGAHLVVTSAMLDTLAYATPNSRGDRPTTPSEIGGATGVDIAAVERLVRHGLLLGEAAGDRLWRLAHPWFRHDWFLSLLAHAQESSGALRERRARPDRRSATGSAGCTGPAAYVPGADR
ncbi:MAG: hypothetical protein ACRDSL_06905 [Pseudonocardiaceae bacterium]